MEKMAEYEAPRAQVCGVFLCEGMAETWVSVRGTMLQDDWDVTDDTEVGAGTSRDGDIVLRY